MKWKKFLKKNWITITIIIILVLFFYPRPCGNVSSVGDTVCDCIGIKTPELSPALGATHYYCLGICLENTCKDIPQCRMGAITWCTACNNLNWTDGPEAKLQHCVELYGDITPLTWDCKDAKDFCKVFIPVD